MIPQRLMQLLIATLLTAGLAAGSSVAVANSVDAYSTYIAGYDRDVTIKRSGKLSSVQLGQPIVRNDKVSTNNLGRAKVALGQDTQLYVASESILQLRQLHSSHQNDGGLKGIVTVEKGMIRIESEKTNRPIHVRIEQQVLKVDIRKPASFMVNHNGGTDIVCLFEGEINVKAGDDVRVLSEPNTCFLYNGDTQASSARAIDSRQVIAAKKLTSVSNTYQVAINTNKNFSNDGLFGLAALEAADEAERQPVLATQSKKTKPAPKPTVASTSKSIQTNTASKPTPMPAPVVVAKTSPKTAATSATKPAKPAKPVLAENKAETGETSNATTSTPESSEIEIPEALKKAAELDIPTRRVAIVDDSAKTTPIKTSNKNHARPLPIFSRPQTVAPAAKTVVSKPVTAAHSSTVKKPAKVVAKAPKQPKTTAAAVVASEPPLKKATPKAVATKTTAKVTPKAETEKAASEPEAETTAEKTIEVPEALRIAAENDDVPTRRVAIETASKKTDKDIVQLKKENHQNNPGFLALTRRPLPGDLVPVSSPATPKKPTETATTGQSKATKTTAPSPAKTATASKKTATPKTVTAEPKPVLTSSTKTSSNPKQTTLDANAKDMYIVQLGVYTNENKLNDLVEKIKAIGYQATLKTSQQFSGTSLSIRYLKGKRTATEVANEVISKTDIPTYWLARYSNES